MTIRLYHFIGAEHGLENLRNRRLKIANLELLNDPFEFIGPDLSQQWHRKVIRGFRRDLAKELGIVCFSRDWRSPVQWAHYADRHRGLCLGFDVAPEDARPVRYVASRLPAPEGLQDWDRARKKAFIDELSVTKFSHWSYEDEYRVFCSWSGPKSGIRFVPFEPGFTLKSVFVGACSSISRRDIESALGDLVGTTEVAKVRPAFRAFKMVRQRKEGLWR